jgi:hypothetical protein
VKIIQPNQIVPEISNSHEQMMGFQRMMQLLPVINRDTLYVLLQFLGLVAENSEDRKADDGETVYSETELLILIFWQEHFEAGATFDNSFVFLRQFKNRSFLGSVFVHVTGRSQN